MKNKFLQGLSSKVSTLLIAALTIALLPATTAFALSAFQASVATGTVGTSQAIEIEYTVDTAVQTWADGDTLAIDIDSVLPTWAAMTWTAEYDSDVTNNATNETQIVAGGGNGQYALSNGDTRLTITWDVTTWGAVVDDASTIRILITANAAPQYAGTTNILLSGATAAGGDTNPSSLTYFDSIVVSAADAAASVELGANAVIGASGNTVLTLTLPVALAATDTIVFTMPSNMNVADTAFVSETFAGAGTFASCSDAGQVITCTAGGAITAGTGTITLSGITAASAASGQTITSLAVNNVAIGGGGDMAVDSSGSITDTLGYETNNDVVTNVTNIKFTNSNEGVVITWIPSSGDSSTHVDILRSKGDSPVNGVPYARVEKSLGKYTDTDVEDGEKVNYLIRTTDGKGNYSSLSEQSTITVDSDSNAVVVVEEESEEAAEETEEEPTEEATPETTEEVEVPTLPDLEGHWSKDVVLNMVARGIVQGDDDGGFRPDGELNRAEAAALLYRVLYGDTAPTVPALAPFSDVATDQWYAGFVAKLKELEIAAGNPDGTYRASASINRAEFLKLALATYYYNGTVEQKAAVDGLKAGAMTQKFADVAADVWYAPTVTVSYELGFIEGMTCDAGTCFNPAAPITRAEATKILSEMFPE